MTSYASGTFDVKLSPHPAVDGSGLGRLIIDKQFHGDLDATSAGEMLSALTGVEGSAAYVALEKVSGQLHGRRGSFILQHTGRMDRGAASLVVTIVPDSGSDELVGIVGEMAIIIDGDAHRYEMTYTLPAEQPSDAIIEPDAAGPTLDEGTRG